MPAVELPDPPQRPKHETPRPEGRATVTNVELKRIVKEAVEEAIDSRLEAALNGALHGLKEKKKGAW